MDENTGHVVCAGHGTHWMNESSLRSWVAMVVWPYHMRVCKAQGRDPSTTKGIIHFDAYPVHTADKFRQWLKEFYPMLLLVYVPAKCTSKMQIAEVAYNRTLKAVFTAQHQQFMMQECRRQMAEWRTAAQVKFSDAVSKCAGRALVWLMKAYEKLEEVHVQSHLEQIGYMRCWEDAEFLGRALESAAVLLPCQDDEGVEDVGVEDGPVFDAEDDILLSMLTLDLGDVELDQAQFYKDLM